jgi:SAM-dependent methyltransferase
MMTAAGRRVGFHLPPRGALVANGPDDPLPYYYRALTGWLYCARIRQALSLLQPPYASVLEVGYGSGVLLPTLAGISDALWGVDLESDPKIVDANVRPLGVSASLLRGDICSLDLPASTFDLVVAMSVFEHISSPASVLESVSRVLRPGGHLLVGMPRVDALMERLFRLIGYRGISSHHVTNARRFLAAADGRFRLVKFAKLPRLAPTSAALYFSMLLQLRTASAEP